MNTHSRFYGVLWKVEVCLKYQSFQMKNYCSSLCTIQYINDTNQYVYLHMQKPFAKIEGRSFTNFVVIQTNQSLHLLQKKPTFQQSWCIDSVWFFYGENLDHPSIFTIHVTFLSCFLYFAFLWLKKIQFGPKAGLSWFSHHGLSSVETYMCTQNQLSQLAQRCVFLKKRETQNVMYVQLDRYFCMKLTSCRWNMILNSSLLWISTSCCVNLNNLYM